MEASEAESRAADLLARLQVPQALWSLSPVTFSGGEQQRVNVARGFAAPYPLLLLDEPTASLDGHNRNIVIEMIGEANARGGAVVGIFHDEAVRLISVMDHTPGQRQFVDLQRYADYYQGKYGMTDAELEAFIKERRVGSTDRGEIALSLRADLVRFRPTEGAPVIRDVWRSGEKVA